LFSEICANKKSLMAKLNSYIKIFVFLRNHRKRKKTKKMFSHQMKKFQNPWNFRKYYMWWFDFFFFRRDAINVSWWIVLLERLIWRKQMLFLKINSKVFYRTLMVSFNGYYSPYHVSPHRFMLNEVFSSTPCRYFKTLQM